MDGAVLKVFVSATTRDLGDCREAVKDILLSGGIHPRTQEHFPPDHRALDEFLRATVGDCDAVICLVGDVFGAAPAASGPPRSYTQLEYDTAHALGKPVFVFLTGERLRPDLPSDDGPAERELQRQHREALMKAHKCELFDSVGQLRERVALALPSLRAASAPVAEDGEEEAGRNWKPRRPPSGAGKSPTPSMTSPQYHPLRRLFRGHEERAALRRYLDQLIEEHRYFTFLGRAKPLELDTIYITLKVGEYVPPQERPDDPAANTLGDGSGARSGALQPSEALMLDPPRLLVLGEPGSGKTTLLKYLALRLASRDAALGEFARKHVPNTTALSVDGLQRHLRGFSLLVLVAGNVSWVAGSVAWLVALFRSPHPVPGLVGLVTLYITFLFVSILRLGVGVSSAVSVAVLVLFGVTGWMPWWSVGAMALTLMLLLQPYWTSAFIRLLGWLRDRWTDYPLPLYLTLNDQAGSTEPIEERLARPLEEAGFRDARTFLRRQCEAGKCVFLMDALDEVVDRQARDEIAGWIGRTGSHGRNPMLVTCRIAAFEADPLEHRFPAFRRMEVQEFTDRQVDRFIQNWFAGPNPEQQQQRIEGLLAALGRNARMRLLAANPLLLSLIALCFERDWRLPERRAELYEKCADVLLEEWDRAKGLETPAHFDRATKLDTLQRLAVWFHQKGIRQFSLEDLQNAIPAALAGRSVADPDLFLQEIMLRSNLIRRKSRTSYDFAHLTFQEYFAAKDFAVRGDEDGLLAHLGDPWWREVILLYAGLQTDATALLERLRRHDLLLAAAARADARTVATEEFARVAGAIIDDLKSWIESDSRRRQEAADALAELPRADIRKYLVAQSLGERQPEVALAAVLALGRCVDRVTLNHLWPELGPILRLLHGNLSRPADESSQRILTVLERLGFEWVFVPAGEFVMGEDQSERRVHLGEYWIGKYPVMNSQFARFVEETRYQADERWRSAFTPGKERHPVVNVSWHEAGAFCEWAGAALASEQQWEEAARGTDGRKYPWGNQWDANRSNQSGTGTTPVDQYPLGVSPYGCYDMDGNVRAWCSDELKSGSAHRASVTRGGSWGPDVALNVSAASRLHCKPSDRNIDLGFRCAEFRTVGPGSERSRERNPVGPRGGSPGPRSKKKGKKKEAGGSGGR
jgi:formylglycine-generating enzyme required for sulfatase activity